MFDSGFLEMIVIAVIALLVVGPERLPGLARKAGQLIGKARAFVNTTKADIQKEIEASEMKSMLSKQEKEISELRDMMQDATQTIHKGIEGLDANLAEKAEMNLDDSSLGNASSLGDASSSGDASSIDSENENKSESALLTDSDDRKKD